jgi:hypothetical protein
MTRGASAWSRAFALRQANAAALKDWQAKRSSKLAFADAQSPAERFIFDRWHAEQRDFARRWMFRNRCIRRSIVFGTAWGYQRVPLFLKRQAD